MQREKHALHFYISFEKFIIHHPSSIIRASVLTFSFAETRRRGRQDSSQCVD